MLAPWPSYHYRQQREGGIKLPHSKVPGRDNTFAWHTAGFSSIGANWNSFFGSGAGYSNTAGIGNSFFGFKAGYFTIGSNNTFSGASAGYSNTAGSQNSFYGIGAGFNNTEGSENLFGGYNAGLSNRTESKNSFVGVKATGSEGIKNATALGHSAQVSGMGCTAVLPLPILRFNGAFPATLLFPATMMAMPKWISPSGGPVPVSGTSCAAELPEAIPQGRGACKGMCRLRPLPAS